jgi:hypothetical protein
VLFSIGTDNVTVGAGLIMASPPVSPPPPVTPPLARVAAEHGVLQQRAVALGWVAERVMVIDDEQGISGTSVENRPGLQRVLAEISLGHVGIVFGREMSRLARSCADWHQLLELCALFQMLLGDADGVYDPADFNDRLLLGLKGSMSEVPWCRRCSPSSWNSAR